MPENRASAPVPGTAPVKSQASAGFFSRRENSAFATRARTRDYIQGMTRNQILNAIEKIKEAEQERLQSALAIARKIARVKDQARRDRTRILIQLGAQFLSLPDRALTTPELQN